MPSTDSKPYRQGIPFSIKEARELRGAGFSYREIAERLGTTVYLVKRVLTEGEAR